MADTHAFNPDWVSAPSETIEDLLDERGSTRTDFAERSGLTPDHAGGLVDGRATLTRDTAARLSSVLGSTPEFWLAREARYRAALEQRATSSKSMRLPSDSGDPPTDD